MQWKVSSADCKLENDRETNERQIDWYVRALFKGKMFRLNKLDSKSEATDKTVQLTSQFNFARLFGRL